VERLVGWRRDAAAPFSLIFRPHPRDRRWRERYAAALGQESVWVQEPSYSDLDDLATLLQHVECVAANAGTVLLDAIVNDRPAVCVLFDEGAPAGERWAELNVTGHHYRDLVESEAFYRARTFEELTAGIERSLADPDALTAERARVGQRVVGDVDGRAAERVVDAIMAVVGVTPD
jgi:CDP-glycerol glycerophosphotransferase (TagB/SpsB family)